MPASLEPDNPILHRDHDALVTPSWLTVSGTSYAIRTVVRLGYRAYKPPTNLATLVFCVALVLIGVCLWYLFRDVVPALVAWVLLIASTTLMLCSAWYAFALKPHYQVSIGLLDGSRILVKRSRREEAEQLHEGLMEAMDWHIGGEILITADRPAGENTAKGLPNWQNPGNNDLVVWELFKDLFNLLIETTLLHPEHLVWSANYQSNILRGRLRLKHSLWINATEIDWQNL